MRSPPPPIRFLLAVTCGWAGFRIALLAPPWDGGPADTAAAVAAVDPAPADEPRRATQVGPAHALRVGPVPATAARERIAGSVRDRTARLVPLASLPIAYPPVAAAPARPEPEPVAAEWPGAPVQPPDLAAPAAQRHPRWSVSAWLFARRGVGAAGLVPAGTLGGSQAGARATYRLTGKPGEGLSLSLRLYAPLNDRHGAEGALGLDWKPLRSLPLRLLVERRARLGRDGRSAFGFTAYGGVDEAVLGSVRLSAYGQAGAVGARRRDLFADGAARLTLPLGRLRLGAGAWAAAQPGVARLDAGPHAELTLRAGPGSVTVAADWRFRLGGRGRPGSGPAVTLSTGF